MYGTFNGWKRQGRVVAAGEQSHRRNDWGDKIFHINQTVPQASRVVVYDRHGNKTVYVNN